jgi:hypothetical protein
MADHPRNKVLVVQKSDMWLNRGLLGDEKNKKKICKFFQHKNKFNS